MIKQGLNVTFLRGPGGSEVDFQFLIVSDRGEYQLPGTFHGMKKYVSLPNLSHFVF